MRTTMRLSYRQEQIMATLDTLGEATAAELAASLPVDISNSALRTHLRHLEKKGYVTYREVGPRFVYAPSLPRNSAAISALSQVMQTFFGGSVERAVTTLLTESDLQVSHEELDSLSHAIELARAREVTRGRTS